MELDDYHADCRYWKLTPYQCANYHLRLATHYVRQSRKSIERATEALKRADRSNRWAFLALGVLVGLLIVRVILG